MCRMFAFSGENRESFGQIYSSLLEVSANDPLSKLISKPFMDHRDGWGLVEYSSGGIRHERFSGAIFKGPVPEYRGEFTVVHARNAAKGQPFGMLNSHPHMRASRDYDLYLAHNGEIEKTRISHDLSQEELENRTDSEVLLDLISTKSGTELEIFEKAIKEVYENEALISGLNLFLVSVRRKDSAGKLLIYSDAVNFNEFHRLHYYEGDGWKSVVSSSLPVSNRFPKWTKKQLLEPGTIYSLSGEGLREEARVMHRKIDTGRIL